MDKIRVVLADNHPTFLAGLKQFVDEEDDLVCLATAHDGESAVRMACKFIPDVIILDVNMPKLSGIKAAKRIKDSYPSIHIIMISAYKYSRYVIESMHAGAVAYLLKDMPRNKLIEAIRMVYNGQAVFCLEATGDILRKINIDAEGVHTHFGDLHERELEIIQLVAKGMSNKMIASRLGISGATVATHLTNIFRKMQVQTRTEATLCALSEGLINIDELADGSQT